MSKRIILILFLILGLVGCSSEKDITQSDIFTKEVEYNQVTYTLSYCIDSIKKPLEMEYNTSYTLQYLNNKKWSDHKDFKKNSASASFKENLPFFIELSLNPLTKIKLDEKDSYRLKQKITINEKQYYVYHNFTINKDGSYVFNESSVVLIKTKK
ncbi:MAG: hypothetical protein ACRCTA_03165 [Bacilli bacterium]